MHSNFKKRWPTTIVSLVALTNLVNANADNAQMRNLENRVTALEKRKSDSGMINPPGRPQVKGGVDLFVFGDLIYWNAHENGLFYAVVNEGSSTNLSDAEVKDIHGKWNFGFRVGAGYNTPHDGWDVNLTWLRFTDNGRKRVHAKSDEFVYPTVAHPADPIATQNNCDKSHAHWNLQLNQLDLDLGREFFVSKWLTLRPHFGLRTDWIHQKFDVDYVNFVGVTPNKVEAELKDKWWGIGIEGGLDTSWGVGSGWSVFGNLTTAIIYGFHHLEFEDEDTPPAPLFSPTGDFVDLESRYRISHAILDLMLGVRWDNTFMDDRIHLGLQVGWEHHIYFSQNQFPNFSDSNNLGKFFANQGDLTLQGWTFAARLDF